MSNARIIAYLILTVGTGPDWGVPSGHMYAALTTQGVELDTYTRVLSTLQREGLLTVSRSHVVQLTDRGRALCDDLKKVIAKLEAEQPTEVNQ